jgi:hypothetical protein
MERSVTRAIHQLGAVPGWRLVLDYISVAVLLSLGFQHSAAVAFKPTVLVRRSSALAARRDAISTQ